MSIDNYELQCRKLLLDFYSAEINSHGRLIIGFAVLMLTLTKIRQNFLIHNHTLSSCQFFLIYSGIFAVAFALWYSLFRLITYGTLANAVIETGWIVTERAARMGQIPTSDFASKLPDSIKRKKQKIAYVLPIEYLISSSWKRIGICAVLAFLTKCSIYWIMH